MPHATVSQFLRGNAKRLRKSMTRAETLLWRQLKARRLNGFGFRRQVPMGADIVDFASHAHRLAIELDGESHDFVSQQSADARRDARFVSRGYRVLRFTNDDVLKNLEGVVLAIAEAAAEAPPSLSLPRKGGGDPQNSAED
jgi:very-short-patch-repair endonuclease